MAVLHLVVFLPHAISDDTGRLHPVTLGCFVGIDIGNEVVARRLLILAILAGRALKAYLFFLGILKNGMVTFCNSNLGSVFIASRAAVRIWEEASRGVIVVVLAGILDG